MSEHTAEQALTHHVALILDNDEYLYTMRRELVAQFLHSEGEMQYAHQLGEQLRELYEQLVGIRDDMGVDEPELPALEVLSTALGFVDWTQLARDYISEEA